MTSVHSNGVTTNSENMPYKEITIPVPWGHISGKWWGKEGIQPILCIHGWQDNAGTFDTLIPLISSPDLALLAIDLPGHGLSSPYPPGQYYYLFWDGIHVVRRIVKYYNWTEPLRLLGHSLGGAISFLYAATYPTEVGCYISIDIASPSVRDPAKTVSQVGEHVDRFLKYEKLDQTGLPGYTWKDAVDTAYDGYGGSCTRNSCEVLLRRGAKEIRPGQFQFTRDPRLKVPAMGFMTLDQVLEFAHRTRCAVMNIRGDPGMTFHDPHHYHLVLDKIEETASRLVRLIVPGTHHVHLNEPEAICKQITEFLKAH